ncbi:hypothetical protein D3C72_2058860 [compost metagenome]
MAISLPCGASNWPDRLTKSLSSAKAREVITAKPSASSSFSTGPQCAAALPRPSWARHWVRNAVFFCTMSTISTDTSGHAIASGSPGMPPPEPTSITLPRAGVPTSAERAAAASAGTAASESSM